MALALLVAAAVPAFSAAGADAGAPAGEKAASPFDRALARVDKGDLAGAVALLEPYVRDPKAPVPARSLLGALYVELGRAQEALSLLAPLAAAEDADPALLYNAGRAALALGKDDEAISYLKRSVARSPGSPAGRELGLLLGRRKETVAAYAALRPWAMAHPDDGEARRAAAVLALQLGRVPEAEELLRGQPAKDPGTLLLAAQVMLQKGDPKGALTKLEPLLGSSHPEELDRDLRRTAAEAYTMTGRAAEAVGVLSGKVEGDPGLSLLLAQAQYQTGDLDQALPTLEPWIAGILADSGKISPPRLAAAILLEYGRDLVTSARPADALPALHKAAAINPGEKQVWQVLGQALVATGQREEAQKALDRFRKLSQSEVPESVRDMQLKKDVEDPTGRDLREVLRLLAQGRPEDALARVRQEIVLAPGDPRPRLLEVRILLVLHRLDEASEAAGKLVRAMPDDPDAVYVRGLARMAAGKRPEAEEDFRRTLELAPDHAGALSDYSVLLLAEGRKEEAEKLLRHLVEIRPQDAEARKNLERLQGGGG